MKKNGWISIVFLTSAVYDAILGLGFLLASGRVFRFFEVTPPNHPGYVHFPAVLLLIFAWMFFRIADDPVRHRGLMPFGIALKCAYCGVVFGHWFAGGLPALWKPFAFYDLAFAALFVIAYVRTRS